MSRPPYRGSNDYGGHRGGRGGSDRGGRGRDSTSYRDRRDYRDDRDRDGDRDRDRDRYRDRDRAWEYDSRDRDRDRDRDRERERRFDGPPRGRYDDHPALDRSLGPGSPGGAGGAIGGAGAGREGGPPPYGGDSFRGGRGGSDRIGSYRDSVRDRYDSRWNNTGPPPTGPRGRSRSPTSSAPHAGHAGALGASPPSGPSSSRYSSVPDARSPTGVPPPLPPPPALVAGLPPSKRSRSPSATLSQTSGRSAKRQSMAPQEAASLDVRVRAGSPASKSGPPEAEEAAAAPTRDPTSGPVALDLAPQSPLEPGERRDSPLPTTSLPSATSSTSSAPASTAVPLSSSVATRPGPNPALNIRGSAAAKPKGDARAVAMQIASQRQQPANSSRDEAPRLSATDPDVREQSSYAQPARTSSGGYRYSAEGPHQRSSRQDYQPPAASMPGVPTGPRQRGFSSTQHSSRSAPYPYSRDRQTQQPPTRPSGGSNNNSSGAGTYQSAVAASTSSPIRSSGISPGPASEVQPSPSNPTSGDRPAESVPERAQQAAPIDALPVKAEEPTSFEGSASEVEKPRAGIPEQPKAEELAPAPKVEEAVRALPAKVEEPDPWEAYQPGSTTTAQREPGWDMPPVPASKSQDTGEWGESKPWSPHGSSGADVKARQGDAADIWGSEDPKNDLTQPSSNGQTQAWPSGGSPRHSSGERAGDSPRHGQSNGGPSHGPARWGPPGQSQFGQSQTRRDSGTGTGSGNSSPAPPSSTIGGPLPGSYGPGQGRNSFRGHPHHGNQNYGPGRGGYGGGRPANAQSRGPPANSRDGPAPTASENRVPWAVAEKERAAAESERLRREANVQAVVDTAASARRAIWELELFEADTSGQLLLMRLRREFMNTFKESYVAGADGGSESAMLGLGMEVDL